MSDVGERLAHILLKKQKLLKTILQKSLNEGLGTCTDRIGNVTDNENNFQTWYVQGIRTKIPQVLYHTHNVNIDIISLTETKKKGTSVEKLEDYIHI